MSRSQNWRCGAHSRRYGLYQLYPGFEERILEALRILLDEEVEKRDEMGLAKVGRDVSGASSL